MTLEAARTLADAVLMEGYALYPYRASAPKNRFRWTFGVLAPEQWSRAGGCEPWWLEAQLLVEGTPSAVRGKLRCLQIERRRVFDAGGCEVAEVADGSGELAVAWDEGVLHEIELGIGERGFILAGAERETAHGGARIVRERHRVVGRIATRLEPLGEGLSRIAIRVENITPWRERSAERERAMTAGLASVHLVVSAPGARLVSAIDPPPHAMAAAARCTNVGTYPVLVGDVMLCAPFAMADHAQIAPESAGDLCDGAEIDELLVLRARTMTDAEKREAHATDPRAKAILDRVDALGADAIARMHGTQRDVAGGEMVPRLSAGAKVRLRAAARGTASSGFAGARSTAEGRFAVSTDAQDLLYAGRVATVADIKRDVDGSVFVAVTIDDDPAAELHGWYGRFHHYRLDEVDLL